MDNAGAPPEQGPSGGGAAETLVELDKKLFQVVSALQKAAIPDEVKGQFAAALESFRAGLEGLMQASGGGGPKSAPPQGVATPEQGANPNARPMSHGGM